MKASDLWVIDAHDPTTMEGDNALDQTSWGLHASLHRHVPHTRYAMHVHSTYATILATLADSRIPAVDRNSAIFHNLQVVDAKYGGLALEEEGARCWMPAGKTTRHDAISSGLAACSAMG